jgi:hypothetical protein
LPHRQTVDVIKCRHVGSLAFGNLDSVDSVT